MDTAERILQFIDYKGFNEAKKGKSLRNFYQSLGISNGAFKKNRSVGSDHLYKLFVSFPELNMDWVITGRGEMLIDINTLVVEGHLPSKKKKFMIKDPMAMLTHELVEVKAMLRTVLKVNSEIITNQIGGDTDQGGEIIKHISSEVEDEVSVAFDEAQRKWG